LREDEAVLLYAKIHVRLKECLDRRGVDGVVDDHRDIRGTVVEDSLGDPGRLLRSGPTTSGRGGSSGLTVGAASGGLIGLEPGGKGVDRPLMSGDGRPGSGVTTWVPTVAAGGPEAAGTSTVLGGVALAARSRASSEVEGAVAVVIVPFMGTGYVTDAYGIDAIEARRLPDKALERAPDSRFANSERM
jgi:hypothetical protein